MAITPNLLTSGGSTSDATSFTTASISPQANDIITVLVYSSQSGADPGAMTVTGNGITWTMFEEQFSAVTQTHHRVVRAYSGAAAAPTAGTLVLGFGAATQSGCAWDVIQWAGADQSGNAIVQSNGAASTIAVDHLNVPLNAFSDPTNNVAVGFFMHQVEEDSTPGTGFTRIGTDVKLNTPSAGVIAEWHLGEP